MLNPELFLAFLLITLVLVVTPGPIAGGSLRCAHVLSSAPHVGSICFFRSNQLLTFAKIGLSATDAALDARD